MKILEIKNLKKSFHSNNGVIDVIENISFSAHEGDFLVILGPSGCGKTTLLNILIGITPYDSGEIHYRGERVTNLRNKAAYMVQKDLLLPWRKVIDNALLFAEIIGKPRHEATIHALSLLEELGLSGFVNMYPAQLSGGMRQRVALARTLLGGKEILLLDEPFGALDAITRSNLQELLLSLWEKYKHTIILVTHDVEEAILLANRVLVLSNRPARIIESVEITIDRPRDVTAREFIEIKAYLLNLLRKSNHPVKDKNGGQNE